MIGEDLQKFSGTRVMRTSAIGRIPIRNLPNTASEKEKFSCKIFAPVPIVLHNNKDIA